MSEELKLKPCPFCGRAAYFTGYDELGKPTIECSRCGIRDAGYALQETAIAAWNRRAPEPGTSIIRWTRYDGTPETLPKGRVLVQRQEVGFTKEALEFEVYFDNDKPCWKKGMTFWHMEIGDVWAYLPEPPEGMG